VLCFFAMLCPSNSKFEPVFENWPDTRLICSDVPLRWSFLER